MKKILEEALNFFDELAKNNQSWNFSYSVDRTRNKLNTPEHGKYTLREQDYLQTKYAQLSRKLESLEIKKIHVVSTPSSNEETCVIYERPGHSTDGCPTLQHLRKS